MVAKITECHIVSRHPLQLSVVDAAGSMSCIFCWENESEGIYTKQGSITLFKKNITREVPVQVTETKNLERKYGNITFDFLKRREFVDDLLTGASSITLYLYNRDDALFSLYDMWDN